MKNNKNKKGILRRVRRQRLKSITILPSLVTILNGVCGFSSIIFASRNQFGMAGFMVLLAMIADMLDGRLARMSQNTSSFGGQLDSLCDIISFGVAPAFIMLKLLEFELELEPVFFTESSFLQRFVWLAAAAYISCAAIRLARFNVENEQDETAHMSFIGLPTPASAGVIISLVIFHQKYQDAFPMLEAILYVMPCIALGVAILMVSRIRYPHLMNQYFRGKKPFGYLMKVLLLLIFICWKPEAALVVMFCGFAITSLAKWLYYRSGILHHLTRRLRKTKKDKEERLESHAELH